ncbi:acetyl/propionyl/methylcrotonyl-CoA carboxylase subunit alpha [Aeromicrobium choanae]|uniref:biotin carboxylase n=1 Tax=Aeromicrobium choanae TaxID=1736691 RepID=A0A1T4Z1A4_9ACTN|nr:biotin carboxylase N-terminal domain-containing protein [Aeromicrobium choanae]SKB07820.1 biotin carboxylase /acetyl-CoA carboxylase carboxyltransferase subunit alpha [Aeromicrobium choanae]
MKKVLIANRGEIAIRIIRACRDLGLTSVALHTAEDASAAYVALADEALPLPGRSAAHAYLDIDEILAAANECGADAVHPGYGFLSESAEFARRVLGAGLTWVGPPEKSIDLLADKSSARHIAEESGARLIPGSSGPVASVEAVHAFVAEHGLPVVIKAVLGGGGRGQRVVTTIDQIDEAWLSARREAEVAFGSNPCMVERHLSRVRHVETQCLADSSGNVRIVGTRDCSLQRRSQKLVEEAPAPLLSTEQVQHLHDVSTAILRAVGYVGAATCEFLLDQGGALYFLEVNTRLQVEHSVTEEATGEDLVTAQLRIADGEQIQAGAVEADRHAIEFRINAEDPGRDFLPIPGMVRSLTIPHGPGVRWDGGVTAGERVTTNFDSLIGKLIVTGPDRPTALARARRALAELSVDGIPTVIDFHRAIVEHPAFAETPLSVHTRWIEQDCDVRLDPYSPNMVDAGSRRSIGSESSVTARAARAGDVVSPITATVLHVHVEPGARVSAGDVVVVVEAMKMEQQIRATTPGTVSAVHVATGDGIMTGQALVSIDA